MTPQVALPPYCAAAPPLRVMGGRRSSAAVCCTIATYYRPRVMRDGGMRLKCCLSLMQQAMQVGSPSPFVLAAPRLSSFMLGSKRCGEDDSSASDVGDDDDVVDVVVDDFLNADFASGHRSEWNARRQLVQSSSKRKKMFLNTCSAAAAVIAQVLHVYQQQRGGAHEMRTYDVASVSFSADDYDDKMFRSYFRFEKTEVHEIIRFLQLPDVIRSTERDQAPAYDVFCMMCMKFAHPVGLFTMIKMFGKSCPVISRLISALRGLLYDRFADSLKNPKVLTPAQCTEFAQRIEVICGMPIVVGFIDGTVRPICKPSVLQGPLYSGKDRVHSLKYQAINTPDGIIRHMAGPYPGSRHDMFALHQSEVIPNWIAKFPRRGDGVPHIIYADQGYCVMPGIETPYADGDFNYEHEAYNQAMASARISVEWEFGAILQNWAALDFKRMQQLLSNRKIGQTYVVAALLTNIVNCLRPNITSKYFKCNPPSLQEYIESLQ